MAMPQAFYCLWQDERMREMLFEKLSNEDICSVRLANSACCNLVTKPLFMRTHLTFTASTFTKPSRVQALSRIAHHIEHLTFFLPHSDATFLPPLIHPLTGREISFLYTPHTSMASVLSRPKYGNAELGDVLTQQYPPLFHAATNVPSFLNAIKLLTNLRHLTIKCPGQDPKERYRRDIVDYALISLRIAVERSPLEKLVKLSLSGIHPAAFNYIRHVPGFGVKPSAGRRWRQIRKLYISVDAWDFYGPSPGLDHLKIIDDYVRNMAPHLEKLSFTWLSPDDSSHRGAPMKGPCPIALSGDPLFTPGDGSRRAKKLFNEVTGPMSPLPPAPPREPMHFPKLRLLTLRNTTMNSPQLLDLVERHKKTIREFDFDNVSLTDGGSWDAAFAPVLNQVSDSGIDLWSRRGHSASGNGNNDRNDKSKARNGNDSHNTNHPANTQSIRMSTMSHNLSPASSIVGAGTGAPAVASPDDIQLSEPSAAVAAVSRELLDMDVEGLETYLGLSAELPYMGADSSEVSAWQEEVAAEDASQRLSQHRRTPPPPTIQEEEEHVETEEMQDSPIQEKQDEGYDEALASDIAAAQEASLTFSTRLKKRRVRRRKRHHHDEGYHSDSEERQSRSRNGNRHHNNHHSHSHSHSRHRHHERRDDRRDDRRERSQSSHRRQRKNSSSSSTSSSAAPYPPPPPPPTIPVVTSHPFAHRVMPGSPPPPVPPLPKPSIVGQYDRNSIVYDDDKYSDDVFRPVTPEKDSTARISAAASAASAQVAPLAISAPILNADPLPVLLQPTVYDPSATANRMAGASSGSGSSGSRPPGTGSQTGGSLSRSGSLSESLRSLTRTRSASSGKQHSVHDKVPISVPVIDDIASSLSPIQLRIEQEEAARRRLEMAEDADARSSALKKAKEAVLVKLSREFNRRMGRETAQMAQAAAAATAAAAAASVSQGYGYGGNGNTHSYGHTHDHYPSLGFRLRERLFGDHVLSTGGSSMAVASDYHRSMESNSAMVPLIFSH